MSSTPGLAKDYSALSMGILSERVRELFRLKMSESSVWMPDTYEWPEFSSNDTLDVVFFGDFFRKFLETGNWTAERYRFWGLGSPTKKFLVQLGGIRDDQISLIPRELLFPSLSATASAQDVDNLTIVYAGRLTASKRILTLLWTVYHLQILGKDVRLSLFGEFFQEEKFCDCAGPNPYKESVLSLIENLNWRQKPLFHGKVRPSEWLENPGPSPVYCSLSVLPFEDFSVSVAQAQASGWSCILTNWGAHKETGGSLIRVPLQIFESLQETSASSEREGKLLAEYLKAKKFSVVPVIGEPFRIPEVVTADELDRLRRAFLSRWGMNFQDVIRHRTDDLRDSSSWESFMKEYLKCFI